MKGNSRISRQQGKIALFYGLNLVLPLTAGLVIYLLSGQDSRIAALLGPIPGLPVLPRQGLFGLLRNYGCDVLWAWSMSAAVTALLPRRRLAPMLAVLLAAGLEFLQKTPLFPGTFDWWDLGLETVAAVTASRLVIHFQNEKGEEP